MVKSVLLVEDEVILALALKLELRREGLSVSDHVTTGEEAIEAARTNPPDLVLMDIRLAGDMDGIEAAARIRQASPVPICFMSGYDDHETRTRAQSIGPLGYLVKPFRASDLRQLAGVPAPV